MLELTNNALMFYAFFVETKVGKTGLTVTVDVYRNGSEIVTGGSATEVGDGLYKYELASGSNNAEGEYICVFKTATSTVDQQHIPALWVVNKAGTENLTADLATILADTNELQGDWANGGRLDLLVDAILADTGELQADWVNGGRLDLLLDAVKAVTDQLTAAQSEPTGAPAVDETPLDKLAYVFMALRNKLTVTSSAKTFFDDSGVAQWSKSLSDDGTTYIETEGA